MKSTIIAATLSSLILSATPTFAFDAVRMNDIIDNSNVIVDGGCSGTIINTEHALVLTNHHCIIGRIQTKKEEIVGKDGEVSEKKVQEIQDTTVAFNIYGEDGILAGVHTYRADILFQDKLVDLALLKVRGDFISTKTASTLLPRDGEINRLDTAIAVGNPLGMTFSSSVGRISHAHRELPMGTRMKKDMLFIQYDGGIVFGNSGGSLYNEAGQLIGVPFAFMAPFVHMGFVILSSEIWAFLDRACWSDVLDPETKITSACRTKIKDRGKS